MSPAAKKTEAFFWKWRQADHARLLTRPHSLRYTLKNKETNTELFVVVIQLMPTDQAAAAGVKSPEEEFKAAHGGEEAEAENDDLD